MIFYGAATMIRKELVPFHNRCRNIYGLKKDLQGMLICIESFYRSEMKPIENKYRTKEKNYVRSRRSCKGFARGV